jgi:hypothetical protein
MTDLLLKFRKGSTAAFTSKDYAAVCAAVPGWTWTETKEARTIVQVTITAPDGSFHVVTKDPHYKRISLYDANPFLKKHGLADAVSAVLGLPTLEEEEAEKVMYGVQYDLSHAGTCPVCFRVQKLSDRDTMVLHGYQRPGDGVTHGSCFGVDRFPLEVSAKGSKTYADFLTDKVIPAETATLNRFRARPETISVRKPKYKDPYRTVEFVIGTDDYEVELARLACNAERQLEGTTKQRDGYLNLVANWVPDIAPIERKANKQRAKMLPFIMAI